MPAAYLSGGASCPHQTHVHTLRALSSRNLSRLTRGTCRAREGAGLGNQNPKSAVIVIDLVR
jgi:hypothetical protein